MKIRIVLLICLITVCSGVFSQVLYSSTTEVGNRFNPGIGQSGTPKVAFDDISIPNSAVGDDDSIIVTKVKVGIRRTPGAPATTVKIYYTLYDDTSQVSTVIKIPPVLLGTVSLPAMGSSLETTIVSVGDSVSALFKMKVDTNAVYHGYHTFFIGTALTSDNIGNALRVTSGPKANKDILWIYDADAAVSRSPASFDNSVATFYIQVFGGPESQLLLPVSLSSFKGINDGKAANVLSWTTESEVNNKGFELQRSQDGIVFNSIAFIGTKALNGSSNSMLSYSYSDEKPLPINYYRLAQRDHDGNITFSAAIFIKGDKSSALRFTTVYPNPAKYNLNVTIASPVSETVNIAVADLSGTTLIRRQEKVTSGENRLSFNVSMLTAGSYLINAVGESTGLSAVFKFIKQ